MKATALAPAALGAALLVVAAWAASCSSSSGGANAGDGGASDATNGGDAISGDADAGADACVLSSLSLSLAQSGSTVTRAFVSVEYRAKQAAFLVDTGSGLTFLQEPVGGPDPVEDAGTVTLGCETLSLIGRAEAAQGSAPNGLKVVGTLGVDSFLRGPTQLDFVASTLTFHASHDAFDSGDSGARAPFDLQQGMVLAHASLDGTPVRLMFDTGSQDTLWLGAQPQPGDVEVQTTDALGNPVTLYEGTVMLTLGTYTATVPVLRAPSFPYFEQTVKDLGGNIQGLLGLSAMGSRVVIDPDTSEVDVTP